MASLTGAWAQDVNLCAVDGVTAKIGDTDYSNVLRAAGAQPNTYDTSDEMNIVVDLLESKTIDGFTITFSGDRWVSEFTLSYSTDGENYTEIDDFETGRTTQLPETVVEQTFTSTVTARYIKYTSKKTYKNVNDGYSETIKNFRLLQYGTLPAVPAIVSDSHQFGIFSHVLGNAPNYGWNSWGGGTGEAITIHGKNAYTISGFQFFGSGFTKMDATGYTTLHIDVYPDYTGTLAIVPIIRNSADTGNDPEKGLQFDVTENTWNALELNLDDLADLGVDMSRMYQIKYVDRVDVNHSPVNGDGTHSFVVGNVYLYGTPIVDTEKPVMTNVVVASTTYKSATLTVNATDNNTTGTLTYTVKNGSDVVGTGTGTQGVDVTVVINGLTASTPYSAGDFTVTATDHAGNVSDPMNVPTFSTDVAPAGQTYINGSHEILVQPRHYTGTFDYELIITSEEAMTGFGNCYWKLNGAAGGTLMNSADIALTDGGKTMTVTVRSTAAPVMDTPLYVMMPGEVTFKEADESNPAYEWVEVAGAKTYDVLVNGDKAAVVGTISSSNLSDFRTSVGNASVVNISGATISGDIDVLTTNNVNALFEYADVVAATAATKTINSVYTADVRFYGAPNGLRFVDDPANVAQLPEKAYTAIKNGEGKYIEINRSIGAGKYVTTFISNAAGAVTAILDEGLEAYELTAAVTGELTFTKVDEISKGKGYVIHNTTAGSLNMKWRSTGNEAYLDVNNQAEGDVDAVDGVKIVGTMHTVDTAGGGKWILSGGEIKEANGAKITAYRAYFTGVTTAARALFIDDETTKIGTIKANGEVEVGEVYNLNGQRVMNPTKGLYIVNGKKVIVK